MTWETEGGILSGYDLCDSLRMQKHSIVKEAAQYLNSQVSLHYHFCLHWFASWSSQDKEQKEIPNYFSWWSKTVLECAVFSSGKAREREQKCAAGRTEHPCSSDGRIAPGHSAAAAAESRRRSALLIMSTNTHKNTHADLQRVPRDRAGEAERVALSQNTRRRNNSHCGCNCGETQRERRCAGRISAGGRMDKRISQGGKEGKRKPKTTKNSEKGVICRQWAKARGVIKWEGPLTSVSLATSRQSRGWEHLLVWAARRGSSCL